MAHRTTRGTERSLALVAFAAVTVSALHARADAPADASPKDTFDAAQRAFEAKSWGDAASGFRSVALSHPTEAFATKAATLYFDALNEVALGESDPQRRDAAYERMAADVPRVIGLHCQGANASTNANACATFGDLQAAIERLSAQRLVERGDKSVGPAARLLYQEGAERYLALFTSRCEAPVAARKAAKDHHCDELAYNAARAFVAAGLAPRAIDTYRSFLAFDDTTKASSPLAKKARLQLGGLCQALTMYDLAAEEYETYARRYPAEADATTTLADATILRIGLGDHARASADADLFVKLYAATKPARAAEVVLAVATSHAERDDLPRALAILKGKEPLFDRAALDVLLRARVIVARAHLSGPAQTRPSAATEYAAIASLWGSGEKAVASIEHSYRDDDEGTRMRHLGKALQAVGEALFQIAEAKRVAEVEPLRPPVYSGPLGEAEMQAHLDTSVREWAQKRRLAIEGAEAAYQRILLIAPVPPPRWVVDAAARVGSMWGDFALDYGRVLPAMSKLRDPERLTAAVRGEAARYREGRAKPAYRTCVTTAAKYQFSDALSKACDTWLVKYRYQSALDEVLPPLRVGAPIVYPTLMAPAPP